MFAEGLSSISRRASSPERSRSKDSTPQDFLSSSALNEILLGRFLGEFVEAVEGNVAVLVLYRPQDLDEAPGRVGSDVTVHTVEVVGGAFRPQLDVSEAFRAAEDQGPPRLVLHRALPQAGVRREQPGVGAHEGGQVGATDLFLPLDKELELEGWGSVLFTVK